ncbi:spore germination protein [Paenibacillus taihuensis]|uniref:Spore germination protein n=1 Tax=Paenibacillus taihuensis TaxID=1156355 RepID=A0A3D9S013_9BACL|nr:GerAB/ArcD/ProY family transporter [Paenibacillus taihuensis]REE82706.1 spore germination protein [Paenibacillus taihuensis]
MNRYFYYCVTIVSMLNLMMFVPYLLIQDRYTGAISSMLLAALIGTTMAFLFTFVMKAFPGKGVPEIFAMYFPKWVTAPLMFFLGCMYFISASIVLNGFAVLINRFLNPDTSSIVVLSLLSLACVYGATRSTLTNIFIVEMGLILNVPLILMILFKSYRNSNLDWDAMLTIAQYWRNPPKLNSYAAAVYLFTGYSGYAIFNRLNPPNFRLRYRWLIPLVCCFIMVTSFFVPIGFHGTEAVASYLYVWSVTADSMTMEYGFLERVVFIFLLLYLNLSLVYTANVWHIAMEFFKSCLPKAKPQIDPERTPLSNWVIACILGLFTVVTSYLLDEKQDLRLATNWLILRVCVEVISVLFLFVLSIGAGGKKQST